MLKQLSISKNQIKTILIVAVFVISKTVVTIYRQGDPGVLGWIISIAMCVLFVLMFFMKFPSKKEDFFKGDTLIRIIGTLIIVFWAFTYDMINFDFNIAMVVLPIMIFCASDIRLMPVNAVISLGVAIRFALIGFIAIPCSLFVSFVLIAPKLKERKTWEKIVFAAVSICYVIDLIHIINELRFMFTLTSVTANIAINVALSLFIVFFAVCAVYSLKKQKTFRSKKTGKKVSVARKPEYFAAVGYVIVLAMAVTCTALDTRYSMSGLVGLLMATLTVCKNGTSVEELSDKAAKSVGSIAEKLFGIKSQSN